jgi:D-galactarolactone cycloisomerase
MIKIKKIRTVVYRYPLAIAVKTSFGTMKDRPMILVQVHDDLGNEGWGEIWCNFPNIGAEHRARLVDSVMSPILLSKAYDDAKSVFDDLTKQTKVLGIQTGEYGPLAQCVAGIDIAIHDLIGKRKGTPIWKMLGGKTRLFQRMPAV